MFTFFSLAHFAEYVDIFWNTDKIQMKTIKIYNHQRFHIGMRLHNRRTLETEQSGVHIPVDFSAMPQHRVQLMKTVYGY